MNLTCCVGDCLVTSLPRSSGPTITNADGIVNNLQLVVPSDQINGRYLKELEVVDFPGEEDGSLGCDWLARLKSIPKKKKKRLEFILTALLDYEENRIEAD